MTGGAGDNSETKQTCADNMYARRIVGYPLGIDSSLDRMQVIVRQEWATGSRGYGGKHLVSLG